ncbi:unnamed protein product, partial [Ectocarpus sp. 12 AP-2014]
METGSRDKTVRRGGRAQAVRCLLSCVTSTEIEVHGEELRKVVLFVHETYLVIDSTANRARYNKAQARATLDHILQMTFSRLEMESPPPSLDGGPGQQASPSPKKRRTSAIEALLSPARRSELSPAAAVEEEEAVQPSSETQSEGDDDDGGVGGDGSGDPRNRLGGVLPGVLE